MTASPLVRIQAHPSRSHLWQPLADAVAPLPVSVIEDPDPAHARRSPLRTYRECVGRPAPGYTHLVILQDDVQVIDGFAAAVLDVVREWPDQMIVLYLSTHPPGSAKLARDALRAGEPYSEMSRGDWIPTVGLIWPVADAVAFGRYLRRVSDAHWADDPIVGGWCSMAKKRVIATVPSLVQHPDTEPSLLGRKHHSGRERSKVALHFTGRWP